MKRLSGQRQEKRHQKVLGGISDLEVWMKDLVRNGFLNVPECAYTCLTTWPRMVDAQAPGLAGETESHGGYRLRLKAGNPT